MTTTVMDPYVVLGIPAGASRDDAARAHRRLAKQYHPDVNPGPAAAERMRRINDAWRILSNPARRTRYDTQRTGTAWPSQAYRGRTSSSTWTTWPESRRAATRPSWRPVRPTPIEPSFGDRPAVFVAVWVVLSLLLFIGTWLGSVAR